MSGVSERMSPFGGFDWACADDAKARTSMTREMRRTATLLVEQRCCRPLRPRFDSGVQLAVTAYTGRSWLRPSAHGAHSTLDLSSAIQQWIHVSRRGRDRRLPPRARHL